ncbi:hypothetical protein E2320_020683 [Naja naja]|nr:hypothetical protein E2320_020683 [Naja naja]
MHSRDPTESWRDPEWICRSTQENQRLRKLDLSLKSPDEKPMELLCNGLNNPEITIKKLT